MLAVNVPDGGVTHCIICIYRGINSLFSSYLVVKFFDPDQIIKESFCLPQNALLMVSVT